MPNNKTAIKMKNNLLNKQLRFKDIKMPSGINQVCGKI